MNDFDKLKIGFVLALLGTGVIEAARAIEAALQRVLFQAGTEARSRGMRDLVEQAIKRKVISAESRQLLDRIRVARNNAVHTVEPVPADVAASVTDDARRVLAMVRYPDIEEDR